MNVTSIKKDLVSSAVNNLKVAREGLKLVRANASVAAKITLALKKILPDEYVNCWAGASGKVYITVSVYVDSFKDDRKLLDVLEMAIEKMGGSAKMETKDYAESSNREYNFEAGDFRLSVSAYLKGEGSANCRRVEVGSKMVEIKEYKFVCDGVVGS